MHFADAFEVFDAVFDGDDEAEGGAVAGGEGLAGHFVAEDGLGVEGAGAVDADIIEIVGGAEADVFEGGFLLEAVIVYEVTVFDAAPPGDLAPAFDAFEFKGKFGFWEFFEIVDGDIEHAAVESLDLEAPGGWIEARGGGADVRVDADVAGGLVCGIGFREVVVAESRFEDLVVDVEYFAQGLLDAIALLRVLYPEPGFPGRGAEDEEDAEAEEGAAVDLFLDGQVFASAGGAAEFVAEDGEARWFRHGMDWVGFEWEARRVRGRWEGPGLMV